MNRNNLCVMLLLLKKMLWLWRKEWLKKWDCFRLRSILEYLNRTRIYNIETFYELVFRRPKGTPLITVCNHDSCCDDPLVFGAALPLRAFLDVEGPTMRWSLGAREICHSNPTHSLFFRLGQVLPIDRGRGIYQPIMNDMIQKLNAGAWLHMFPEGCILHFIYYLFVV